MRPRYATTAYVEALCLVRRDSHPRWYRGATVRGRRVFSTLLLGAWGAGGALLAAGCGQARQDAHEPKGTFTVRVVKASFPARQAVARQSRLELVVRNTGTRTVPNVAVTIDSFAYTNNYPELASNKSPVWVVEQGPGKIPKRLVESEEISPPGGGQTTPGHWARSRPEERKHSSGESLPSSQGSTESTSRSPRASPVRPALSSRAARQQRATSLWISHPSPRPPTLIPIAARSSRAPPRSRPKSYPKLRDFPADGDWDPSHPPPTQI